MTAAVERIRYRRLPGRQMGFVRCPSAWMGDDHILIVGGTRFHEIYQRVYFRDVQALVIRRKARFVMQWPYLLPIPFVVAAFLGGYPRGIGLLILGAVAIAAVARAVFAVRFGCHLDLATAVGNVRVRSVASTWTAGRFGE